MPLKPLHDYLTAEDKRELDNVRECARRILERPVDLAYTDHTIAHKDIVAHHLDSFLRPWLDERARLVGERLVRTEVMVLLCATYLHDIGMQMVHPDILAALPSFTDEERAEAARLSLANVTEDHRLFARRHHHRIGFDWITGSQGDIPGLPRLNGIDGFRLMVAKVARAHNIWLTDPESYDLYKTHVEPEEEPDGTVRLDLLAAFLRLADILDQDKRRVDLEAMKRLPVSPVSKVHWWRHHYVNACRIDTPTGHNFPLKVAFRLPKAYETDHEWLKEALYSATVKEVEAETIRLRNWLGECGINVVIPPQSGCRFTIDPDAVPMPPEVLEAFSKTWRRAAGSSERANLRDATAKGELTANALADALLVALPRLAASVEIDEYIANTRRSLDGEFRDTPYSPLELRVDNQPELRSALDHLERQLQAPQVRPHPIVVIGVPGGGKTMLLRRYVWEWSGRTRAETPLPLYIQATRFGTADWAKEVERRLGTTEAPCSDAEFRSIVLESLDRFETLLAQSLCELAGLKASHEGEMRGALVALLARTPLAVFFDGINELPPMLYQLANHAVHAFLRTYRGHRVVVTSRTGDFRPGDFPDRVTCELAVMTEGAVTDYWAKAGVSSSAIRYFLEKASSGVREMVRTPMAAYMTGELLKLPDQEAIDNQGRLFQRYVRQTLRQWSARKEARSLSVDQAQELLAEIAFRAFQSEQVAFSPALASTVVRKWFLKLEPEDAALLNPNGEAPDAVFARLSRELLSTSFLREVGDPDEPSLRFRHHTLQDYFAATAIATRWEELPTIVAQPVFHEAVSLLADVVDDPAQFIDRLTNATSNQWGFVHLLPLLFRVIGASRLPVPQRVKLRVYAATLPLYSAAVALSSPFAAEVLCHLFSMVDWTVLGGFLAFIADERNTRPEWERELARVDVIKVMNQEGTPNKNTLLTFFSSRISDDLCHDYEIAKTVFLKKCGNINDYMNNLNSPLLIGGIVSSIALTPEFKNHISKVLLRLSINQTGQLQAILIEESASFGAMITINTSSYDAFLWITRSIYDFILIDSDFSAINGDFDKYYDEESHIINVKIPIIQRKILNSKYMSDDRVNCIIRDIDNIVFPDKFMICSSKKFLDTKSIFVNKAIHPDVEAKMHEIILTDIDVFFSSWLHDMLDIPISKERWQSLEDSLTAAEAAGYWLSNALKQPVPKTLNRYAISIPNLQKSNAIERLMTGDDLMVQQFIASVGLNTQAIIPLLDAAKDPKQLNVIANCVYKMDRSFGRVAQIQVLSRAKTEDDVDYLMSAMNLTAEDVANSECFIGGDLTFVISYLSKKRMPIHFQNIGEKIKWEIARGETKKAFTLTIQQIDYKDRFTYGARIYDFLKYALEILNDEKEIDEQKNLSLCLFKSVAQRIERGQLVDWFIPFAHTKVKSGILPTGTVSAALVRTLHNATPELSRPERRRLFDLLQEIDEVAITRCFDVYLDACPVGGEATANHLGNGAWAFYKAGDDARLLELTERALVSAPQADWLLANRAFALHLVGRPETEVLDAYAQALIHTPDRERWHRVAVEDLQRHHERRPQAPPIATPFIDKIVALGQSLPAAPPDPPQVPA